MKTTPELIRTLETRGTVTRINPQALETAATHTPSRTPTTPGVKKGRRRRSKYGNRAVYLTSEGFVVGDDHPGPKRKIADSRKEWRRYLLLLEWQRAGLISGLVWQQTVFPLHAKGGRVICRYRPDAVYVVKGRRVVEDVKGKLTELYKLKRRWMLVEYGIRIHEV